MHHELIFNQAILSPSYRGMGQKYLLWKYRDISKCTILEKMEELGLSSNKRLLSILFCNWNNYGIPLKESPLHLLSLVSHFAAKGYIYPKGGPIEIVKSILSVIQQQKGEFFTRAKVAKILVDGNCAKGVELKDGSQIFANRVISTMGYHQTLDALPEANRWKIDYKSHEQCKSACTLFVGFNAEGFNLPAYNIRYFPCG